jgi:hypothetical protein
MAQTKEEKSLAAKRARAWKLYRITLEEQDAVETFMRNDPTLSILLQKSDPLEQGNLYNDHSHSSGLYRGRLSYLINKGLGVIEGVYKERTPRILRALAEYLVYPPAARLGIARYGMIGRAKLNKKKVVYGSPTGPLKPEKGKAKNGK